jgi:hypothetical protein
VKTERLHNAIGELSGSNHAGPPPSALFLLPIQLGLVTGAFRCNSLMGSKNRGHWCSTKRASSLAFYDMQHRYLMK